jgi:hypothetical protein
MVNALELVLVKTDEPSLFIRPAADIDLHQFTPVALS